MKMYIKRTVKHRDYTIGQLWINGEFVCDTLEDTVRVLPETCPNTPKWKNCRCVEKIYAETAIPAGKYEARVSYSPRFKRYLVEIMNVPHFLGIRIHGGNHKDHTEGCVLVGEYADRGLLKNSQKTLSMLHDKIKTYTNSLHFNEKCGKFEVIIE